MFVVMTIQDASQQLLFELSAIYEVREASNITDWVIEKLTGWKKIDRVINKQATLSTDQEKLFRQYAEALLKHTPVQYVLNESWFCGMKLYVNEQVLIPRPETEELVEWIVSETKRAKGDAAQLLDIGTGSGCIPLGLKKAMPGKEIHSCDISESALAIARSNAIEQHLDIRLHLMDFLSREQRNSLPQFDVIVSNPPYIPLKDQVDMAPNVLNHEPHLALFVPDGDPLLFYRAIADFSLTHLKKEGSIYLEIHEKQGQATWELFKQKGFEKMELRKDLQGKDRMMKINS